MIDDSIGIRKMNRKVNMDFIAEEIIPIQETITNKQNIGDDELYGLTFDAIVKNNPGKVLFNYSEAGTLLNVKDEFIRRRVLNGLIKATYIGDKPMIHITEITRLTLEGVK